MRLLRRLFALGVMAPLALTWIGTDPAGLLGFEGVDVSAALITASLVVGSLLCATPAWRTLRYVDTLFHEIGHAVVAALAGAKVRKISVHFDASGLAAYQMPAHWGRMRRVCVALAGYPFPAAVGLGAVVPLTAGSSVWAVWYLAAVAAGAVVLLVRNVWGVAVTLLVALVLHLLASNAHGMLTDAALAAIVGVLLVGSVRAAWEQLRLGDLTDSDAATVGGLLHLPGRFVAIVQVLVCCAFCVVAAWRLGIMLVDHGN